MKQQNTIQLFENKKVRTFWNSEQEKWYVSIIDVVEALTDTDRPRKYWSDLKAKLIKEGSELSEKIGQLKMKASDGKMRLTDSYYASTKTCEMVMSQAVNKNYESILYLVDECL